MPNLALAVLDNHGKEIEKLALPEAVFDGKVNQALLHQAVVMYQANTRQGKLVFIHHLMVLARSRINDYQNGVDYKQIEEDRLLASRQLINAAKYSFETENNEEISVFKDIMWSMGIVRAQELTPAPAEKVGAEVLGTDLPNDMPMDDPEFGAFAPDDYFKQYSELIKTVQDQDQFGFSQMLAKALLDCIPIKISIADVYVPYCFANPERIQTTKGIVHIEGLEGKVFLGKGEKHQIVTDIDFEHFKDYIEKYIR